MTIKEVKEKLETSIHPVAKSLHQGTNFKVLMMGFKKGMTLKEHKANLPTKLTVLEGAVRYIEESRDIELNQYDEVEIPVSEIHSVEALTDSLCVLTKG